MAINSSTHSSFSSSRESSSLSPHATGGAEDSQDAPAIGSVGTSASSPQKRSKSLSEYTSGGDIQSSPSATLSSTFSFSMNNSQVNTTSGTGVYSSSPQRQRLYSAPNIKGMQPLSHAPTMMSTKHSPTMNHFSLPRGYGQMTQPPPYGHYQGYAGYGGYATAAGGASYQPQTPFSPTYNNYSTGAAVAGTPYLVHPGPPGSTLYSVNAARPPSYPTQQTSAMNMSSGYFPYSTGAAASNIPTVATTGLLASSTGAMTTQQSANYNSTTAGGYPVTGFNGTTSSTAGNSTMFSQPSTVTGGASLNAISEGQGVLSSVSMPASTSSAVCDINSLDLPTTLATTAGDLDTSQDSVASDSSFPVVSLPSSIHQHQPSLSELDSQNPSTSNDANGETPHSEVPVILHVESHATTTNDSAKTAASQGQVNGSNCEKEQVYTKRLAT